MAQPPESSASASPARPLAAWLQLLESKQPPLDPAASAAVLELLADGASAAALVPALLRDPALVLLLFREANGALARYHREAHTLEHAISLLGVSRIQVLIEAAPLLSPQHPQADAYRLALLRSAHAAAQARLWAEGTGLWPAEEVFWSTLLAAAPLWLLRLEAGELLHQLDLHRAEYGAISRQRVREQLGCSLGDIAHALGARWLLPAMSQLCWQTGAAGTLRQWIALERSARLNEAPAIPTRELTDLCHHPALVVAVANALASEADWDWYSRRCQRLLKIAATACRRPLSTLIAYCHQTAANISRDHWRHRGDDGLPTPGAKLLGHWQQARCWFAAEPQPAHAGSDCILAACIQQLRQPEIRGVRDILEIGVRALHQGVGLRRVAVLFVKPGTRELQTVLSAAGTGRAPALERFRWPLQQSPLLTQLLAKPVCLLVDADNRSKYLPHLPEPLRAELGRDNCVLMPVFSGEGKTGAGDGARAKAIALLYADDAPAELAPGSRKHTLFRQLCQQLSRALAGGA